MFAKDRSFLVWYSIDRGIHENESIFCLKKHFFVKKKNNSVNPVGSGSGLPQSQKLVFNAAIIKC